MFQGQCSGRHSHERVRRSEIWICCRGDQPTIHSRLGCFDGQRIRLVHTRRSDAHSGLGQASRSRCGHAAASGGSVPVKGCIAFPQPIAFSNSGRRDRLPCTRQKTGWLSAQVFRLFEDSRGNVWISTIAESVNGLALWDRQSERVRDLRTIAGTAVAQGRLSASRLARTMPATSGLASTAVWRATRVTPSRSSPRATACHPARFGTSIVDRSGRLWLASDGGGLVRVDDTGAERPTFVSYTTSAGTVEQQHRSDHGRRSWPHLRRRRARARPVRSCDRSRQDTSPPPTVWRPGSFELRSAIATACSGSA